MKTRRILMSVAGVLVGGMFAGLFQFIAFGVDPFQCFVNGAHAMIPISFGTLYVILNALLLTFALIADRHYIGLATLINMFLLGYVVEFTYKTLCGLIPAPSMALRVVLVPVALIISETWHKMRFRYCRILTDVICVLLGSGLFLLSGKTFQELTAIAGVGTILTAFCMGPVIEWCNEHISRPLLGK